LLLLIYLISVISRRLYDGRKHIRSTISLLFYIVPNLTKQWYNNFESVQKKSKRVLIYKIFLSINLIIALISKPYAMLYSLDIKTLWVTLLHLIKD
jgi:hypothetical protein